MSARGWSPRRVDPDRARRAVEAAAEELREARLALGEALIVIQLLADRRMPERATDPAAEVRVIGWACSGRAKPADFEGLELYDFSSDLRRRAYVSALALVDLHVEGKLAAFRVERPSIALLLQALSFADPELAGDYAEALALAPCPATAPRREIDLVAALGRAWSGIEERFEMEGDGDVVQG